MFRALTIGLIFTLATGAYAAERAAVVSQPSPTFDADAEREFLALTNQARAEAGLPALQADEGLTQAARTHAAAMAERELLSHQLSGEPALLERITATSAVHFDHAGENVAYAGSVAQAQSGLMHSPPHRENLLSSNYNLVGIGVAWSGFVLYVAEDFGHSLPTYSGVQAEELVANSIEREREAVSMPVLTRINDQEAQAVACSMAQADSISTPGPRNHAILRYTTMQPEVVPASVAKLVTDPRARSFSVGSCYARTNTYPSGVYWVTLIFY